MPETVRFDVAEIARKLAGLVRYGFGDDNGRAARVILVWTTWEFVTFSVAALLT